MEIRYPFNQALNRWLLIHFQYLMNFFHSVLKKIEIFLLLISAIAAYGFFLVVIYTEMSTSYMKLLGAVLPVLYINVVGIYVWKRKIQ